jgi:hypothetical protein
LAKLNSANEEYGAQQRAAALVFLKKNGLEPIGFNVWPPYRDETKQALWEAFLIEYKTSFSGVWLEYPRYAK